MNIYSTPDGILEVSLTTSVAPQGVLDLAHYLIRPITLGAVAVAVRSVSIADQPQQGIGYIGRPDFEIHNWIGGSSMSATADVMAVPDFTAAASSSLEPLATVVYRGAAAFGGAASFTAQPNGAVSGAVSFMGSSTLSASATTAITQVAADLGGQASFGATLTIDPSEFTRTFFPLGGTGFVVGGYLSLNSPSNQVQYARIVAVNPDGSLTLDRDLLVDDPMQGSVPWSYIPGVTQLVLTTNKPTNGATYTLDIRAMLMDGSPYAEQGDFVAVSSLPSVVSAVEQADGDVLVTFSETMKIDAALLDPREYSLYPAPARVVGVRTVSANQVLLKTLGLTYDDYTLIVNAEGTPHDSANNPMGPVNNTAVFSGSPALASRSIYVDHGPITKPELVLQSGSGVTFTGFTQVSLTGANITTAHLGLYIRLSGSVVNAGDFKILSRVSATTVKLDASFSLPDVTATGWELIDPRNGEIADSPDDVTVRINGVQVTPEAVIGLLGQIVLTDVPAADDDVKVNYCWIRNPTVDVLRFNSREFRFNNWNNDYGLRGGDSTRHYRYNNGLVKPATLLLGIGGETRTGTATFSPINSPDVLFDPTATFTTTVSVGEVVWITSGTNNGLRRTITGIISNTQLQLDSPVYSVAAGTYRIDPPHLLSTLDAPMVRDLKYRAFERAYSVAFNDPNLLLFNSPLHKIAYPTLSRTVAGNFINYQGTVLPESDPVAPWTRHGTGSAVVAVTDLVITDTSTGPFPAGNGIFWTYPIDLTYPHVYAIAWRMFVNSVPAYEGVFSGIAAGYADESKLVVVGFLEDSGVKKIGILKLGYGNDPSTIDAWTGALDGSGNGTGVPEVLDWSVIRSYRIFRDRSGSIGVYIDGSIVPTLRVSADQLPYMEEVNAPFDELQGAFFGSLSREAENQSTWSFVRFTTIPINPLQSAPSVTVSYEATTIPEEAGQPWTPVGFHGTEWLQGGLLVLDSTSASDADAGLISSDFRGYTRIEPLLRESYSTALDVAVSLISFTHGIDPNAAMFAVDDGDRLMQVCFFPEVAAPKFSYGGRALPPDFSPYSWSQAGDATAAMVGQYLRITDDTLLDGIIYYLEDTSGPVSPNRVVGNANNYTFEFRVKVSSYTPDLSGFSGVTTSIYDGVALLGLMLSEVGGTRYVSLHTDGSIVAQFPFEWFDGEFHTFRGVRSYDTISVFADLGFLGSASYANFIPNPAPVSPVGVMAFGSATSISTLALSVVDWAYANFWRVEEPSTVNKFVGIWKGYDPDALTGYHLPVRASGFSAAVNGNVLTDTGVDFLASGVTSADRLVIDDGPNKGTYLITTVLQNSLTTTVVFPQQPSVVSYRVVHQVDWSTEHQYRLFKDASGGVAVFLDGDSEPLIHADYSNLALPPSSVGVPFQVAAGLASVSWGAYSPDNLSQTRWNYVRYSAIRSSIERGIVPHHQIFNQRNVMASYEHHRTNIPHTHTDFWSESEGVPPSTDPDLLRNTNLTAFTLLNDSTPLVPSTQTYQVRKPSPTQVFSAAFNDPEQLLNDPGFVMNNGASKIKIIVPDDVLYNCLEVIETQTGEADILAPFDDEVDIGSVSWNKTVCLTYEGDVLPENDTTAATPWTRVSDDPAHQYASAFSGVLTYGTDSVGTRTLYRNDSPLPSAIGLQTDVSFRLKLTADASFGLGDSQVRFGFSSPGVTIGLAFITTPLGERYVFAVDLNSGKTVGGIAFDFYDGEYHTYVITRDPRTATMIIRVDP